MFKHFRTIRKLKKLNEEAREEYIKSLETLNTFWMEEAKLYRDRYWEYSLAKPPIQPKELNE